MKAFSLGCFVFFAIGGLVFASEDKQMLDLANKKGCLACHQLDVKIVGPSWLDVSKKYTEKDIPSLVQSILNGSQGKWGQVPMPPNKGLVSEEEANKFATWIIKIKEQKKEEKKK